MAITNRNWDFSPGFNESISFESYGDSIAFGNGSNFNSDMSKNKATIYISNLGSYSSITLNYTGCYITGYSGLAFGLYSDPSGGDYFYTYDEIEVQPLSEGDGSVTISVPSDISSGYLGFAFYDNSTDSSYCDNYAGLTITSIDTESVEPVKITLNANGGSGGTQYIYYNYGVETFYSNYACTNTITSITIPTKSGYLFKGYYGDGTFGGNSDEIFIRANGSIYNDLATKIYANATLYAKYDTAPTYSVTYDANGGSGAPSSVSGVTSITISSVIPTRFGYTFLGWSTSSSATSATYQPGGNLNLSKNTTLYAVWQSSTTISSSVTNSSYSVSISFSGAYKFYSFTPSTTSNYRFESSGSIDTQIYLYNSSGTQLAWNDDSSSMGNNFLLDYNFTAGTKYYIKVKCYSTKTGTFNFTVKRLYTITYNANGGSGAPSSQTKIHGTDLTLSTTQPTREGSTFLGWSTSSTATSATYSSGSNFTTNADTTLYAIWNLPKYTITYNANGGSGAPSNQTKTHGTVLTLSTTVPTRFAYTFLGWSESSSATSATYQSGSNFDKNANTTLYAIWQPPTIIPSNVTNGSYSASITSGGVEKYYEFTPAVNSKYRFESSGNLDTRIYLYNANGALLDSDDDDGDGRNFLLDYNFTKSTKYYIKVRFYSNSTTGTINFTVKQLGFVYIYDNDKKFSPYQILIYDGSEWNQYVPYIYNGENWELYC